MRRKYDTFELFKEYRALVKKQLGKPFKTLQSDRGGEYLAGEFEDHLKEEGIISQLTAPRDITAEWHLKAEKQNSHGYGEVDDELLIPSEPVLGLCLGNCSLYSEPGSLEICSRDTLPKIEG